MKIGRYETHPAADLFPMMSEAELRELADDIVAHGLLEPIVLLHEQILDGRNRAKACEMVGIEPRVVIYSNERSPVEFVLAENKLRRHMTPGQLAAVAIEALPMLQKEAAERKKILSGTRANPDGSKPQVRAPVPQPECGKATDIAAKAVGIAPRTLRNVQFVKNHDQAAFEAIKSGTTTPKQAVREIKKAEKQKAREEAVKEVEIPSRILIGDFRQQASQLKDNSLDLIFTDPPYDRASVGLYEDLAKFAADKLIDGGSVLAYGGQYLLPEILAGMAKHLRLWWVCSVVHGGPLARMREYGIIVGWKPIVWFVKGTRADKETWVTDLYADGTKEKKFHDWQQDESEAGYFIELLCQKDGIVCDPFLGSGTTAAAAKALNRRWIGIDIDAVAAKTAAKRLL